MRSYFKLILPVVSLMAVVFFSDARAENAGSVSGTYKTVLKHEGANFHQFAKITLRTVNMGGELNIAANLRIFFGEADSNEFLSYDYDDVKFNVVTRQISLSSENSDITLVGFLKEGRIEGEWYSIMVGRVGTFEGKKGEYPQIADGGIPVQSLSGYYKGTITSTNPDANLPEKTTISFVTTQDFSEERPVLKISGKARLYLGEFNSLEYLELNFDNIQFNFYSRYLTAKTQEHGLTFKGTMSQNGVYEGVVLSDALGTVGTFKLDRVQR